MKDILRLMHFSLWREMNYNTETTTIKNILQNLNSKKIQVIEWFMFHNHRSLLKELLEKTGLSEWFFYYNNDFDHQNKIKNLDDLQRLLNKYIKLNNKPKVIILENCQNIEEIETFIYNYFHSGYKIILIGNNWTHIKNTLTNNYQWVSQTQPEYKSLIAFWKISDISFIKSNSIKEHCLQWYIHQFINDKICINKWVKNIFLYKYIITFLSLSLFPLSLRELHQNINETENISLKTCIDYIDYSLEEKLLIKVPQFDLKKWSENQSKNQYYFCDNWIRNSFNWYTTPKSILQKNLVLLKLYKNFSNIYSWKNWVFEFDFYIPISKNTPELVIHFSEATEKNELKIEINKLNKIQWNWKRILLIKNKDDLSLKKFQYEQVEIIEIENYIMNF